MKYFEKLEEFFQRSIVELYFDLSNFFYVDLNSFLHCEFIYYKLHEHSIILIKLPLVKRYGYGNGLRSSFWKSIPYSQNFVSNKRKAIHNRIIQTSFRRRKGRVEDKRKEESSEEAGRTFAGYQEEKKKKVWEIRCHEWTNFLIRAKQRDHTPKSRCPSAISSSIRPNPWKSPRHDPRSTWCVPCSWRRASGSRRIMIGHESKNQETTYSRHLLYAAISRTRKNLTCRDRAADRAGRNYPRGGVCTCSSFRGDRMDLLSVSVSFIRWKRTVSPGERRIHGFFLPSIDEIIFFRDASAWSPWQHRDRIRN